VSITRSQKKSYEFNKNKTRLEHDYSAIDKTKNTTKITMYQESHSLGSKVKPFNPGESMNLSRIIAMVASAKPKRSIAKEVQERVRSRKCLQCDRPGEKRGLCSQHYQAFMGLYHRTPDNEKAALEDENIREGRILACGEQRKLKSNNPFIRVG